LQFSLAASCVPCKHVENQHRPVDDAQRNDVLQVDALPRPQVVQDEERVRAERRCRLRDLVDLALSEERCRIDSSAPLHDFTDDARTGRARERGEFLELRFERRLRVFEIDGGDERANFRALRAKVPS